MEKGERVSIRGGWIRNWQSWTPYAAVIWSLAYAVLGLYWAVWGNGFPYAPELMANAIGPVAGLFGPGAAWTIVIAAGLPAAVVGILMLRGVRLLRPFLMIAGALFTGVLLLLMTDITLLMLLGYTPYGIIGLITGAEIGRLYLQTLTNWMTMHQLLCFSGGFLWLAATVGYARRSGDACLSCGRRPGPEGWKSPESAKRWGRIAVYISIATPVFYALTRYAWALGIPLGISEEFLRRGQETGMWTSGIFLATFGLVGALLTLGLTQGWGEVFPRWMIGLAGRRVPIKLAVFPAAMVSALTIVGGIAMWSGLPQMVAASVAGGTKDMGIIGFAPTALFPVWGLSLAVATLGYYYRRRGVCGTCGCGAPVKSTTF